MLIITSEPVAATGFLHDRQDFPQDQAEGLESYARNDLLVNGDEAATNENNHQVVDNVFLPDQSSENHDSENQSHRRPRTEYEESTEIYLEFHLQFNKRHKK